jgi:hypothetical protein
MMNINYLVLCIICCGLSYVQGNGQALVKSPPVANSVRTASIEYPSLMMVQFDFKMPLKQLQVQPSAVAKQYPSINHLPGMFCKLEYKIETRSKVAPRFRLGSLQYTEWMEGKQDFYSRFYK